MTAVPSRPGDRVNEADWRGWIYPLLARYQA
jgi:hypothetical protein